MADKDNLNDIIERILRGSQTDADIEKLRRSLKIVEGVLQLVSQNGEFNTNIGQITGGDIHLGDRTYQGADAATIQQIVRNIFQETKATQRPRKEESLLDNVKKEVKGRLTKSLFVENAKPINLKKELQPELVNCPWNLDIKIGFNSNQFTSDEPQIIDVFNHDEIGGKLLIIGEPGSGKTTTLLELAQILVTLAEEQHLKPIPVLLNLASWQNPRQPFRQWIIVELSMKYGQSSQTIEQWLNEQKLLPLLDGLDELESSLYQDCIRGINIFLSEVNRPPSLIVCTRKEEYINAKIKLKLNGAVCLLPLSDDQIQNYLQQIQNFPHSHTLIQDTILMDLIRIPLFLNLAIVTCQEISLEKWQKIDSSEERLQYLWNTYIYKRLIDDNNAKSKKIRVWLTWIAQQLAQESKFDFVIAQLQPSKTLYGNQKNIYILILFIIISSIVEICIHINNGLEIKLIKNEIPQLIMLINDIMPQLIIAILVVSFSLAFSYFIKPLMLFLLKIIKFIFSRFSNLLGIFNSIIYLPLSISIFIIFIYKISSLAGLLVLYFLILLPFNILPFNYNYESFDLLHWLAFPVKFFKNITILIAITAIAFCLALPIFFAFFLLSILVSVGLIIVFINVIQPIEKLIVS